MFTDNHLRLMRTTALYGVVVTLLALIALSVWVVGWILSRHIRAHYMRRIVTDHEDPLVPPSNGDKTEPGESDDSGTDSVLVAPHDPTQKD